MHGTMIRDPAELQFNRVGREVNATVVNKLPNDHSALVGPINPL
ncbi:hypothetical protein [Mesorhizobium sp. M0621]